MADLVDLVESRPGVVPVGQVRIGIWDVNSDPGLVGDRPVAFRYFRACATVTCR